MSNHPPNAPSLPHRWHQHLPWPRRLCIPRFALRAFSILLAWTFWQTPCHVWADTTTEASRDRADDRKRILVGPAAGVSPEALDRLHASNGCEVLQRFPCFGGLEVLLIPKGAAMDDLIRLYQGGRLVAFAEPDHRVRLAGRFPNDPAFLDGSLWGLNNVGQNGGLANADVDAPEGWSAVTSASNVIVAVVDTGIRYTHEDLAANIWTHPTDGSHGINALDGTSDPNDDNGHGTALAGVIGATGNNGLGVAGLAWRVQLMACKFADRFGNGSVSDVLTCLDYARTNGARIVNASWGLDDFSPALSNAMASLRSAGILVVAAAGNDARDIDNLPYYPACYDLDNIISVAATTRRDELYLLSNFGATNVDLAAPGDEIYSTDSQADDAYALEQGTSLAAACVSGAAALLRAGHSNEAPASIINRLLASVDLLPVLVGNCVSGGRLNLRKALEVAVTPPMLHAAAMPPSDLFILSLTADPGRSFVIETSVNLQAWTPVATNITSLLGSLSLTNHLNSMPPASFFRAQMVP